jgi:hypothetical protein
MAGSQLAEAQGHLIKSDRHKPGYMREYMRRRRAAAKAAG